MRWTQKYSNNPHSQIMGDSAVRPTGLSVSIHNFQLSLVQNNVFSPPPSFILRLSPILFQKHSHYLKNLISFLNSTTELITSHFYPFCIFVSYWSWGVVTSLSIREYFTETHQYILFIFKGIGMKQLWHLSLSCNKGILSTTTSTSKGNSSFEDGLARWMVPWLTALAALPVGQGSILSTYMGANNC